MKELNKKGLTVTVINNNVNAALSILKRRLNDEGIKKELRNREFYMSRGEKARRAKAAGKRRNQKRIADQARWDINSGK